MAVKIRLARRGRRKQPFYHIIVADARSPRDGKFIEKIGSYNPMTKPATIDLDRDKAFDWLQKGAQPTETARSILRFKGVLYKKHLQRGVSKGAISQEEADTKYQEYIDTKEAKVAARFEETLKEKLEFHARVSGTPGKVYVAETAATEALADFQEAAEPAVEAAAEPAVEAAAEPVVEAAAEPVVEAAAEPVVEAAAEPVVEAAAEPVVEAVAEPVVEAAAEPVVEATAEKVTEAAEEVKEAVTSDSESSSEEEE